jgi:hypothetical protein
MEGTMLQISQRKQVLHMVKVMERASLLEAQTKMVSLGIECSKQCDSLMPEVEVMVEEEEGEITPTAELIQIIRRPTPQPT